MAAFPAALIAAAVLFSSAPLRAQEPAPAPSPNVAPETPVAPAASPSPAPTPLPLLKPGPTYETLRGLAAALQTEAQHALDGVMAAANRGRMRMFVPGARMFARRTAWLHKSIDDYQTSPFDVVSTVNIMHTRLTLLHRRMRANPALESSWEDWDNTLDIVGRMQKLLAGETVTVPPPHTPRPLPPEPSPSPAAAPSPAPVASPSPTPSPKASPSPQS